MRSRIRLGVMRSSEGYVNGLVEKGYGVGCNGVVLLSLERQLLRHPLGGMQNRYLGRSWQKIWGKSNEHSTTHCRHISSTRMHITMANATDLKWGPMNNIDIENPIQHASTTFQAHRAQRRKIRIKPKRGYEFNASAMPNTKKPCLARHLFCPNSSKRASESAAPRHVRSKETQTTPHA